MKRRCLYRKRGRSTGVQWRVSTSVLHRLSVGFHQRRRRTTVAHFTTTDRHRSQWSATDRRPSARQVRHTVLSRFVHSSGSDNTAQRSGWDEPCLWNQLSVSLHKPHPSLCSSEQLSLFSVPITSVFLYWFFTKFTLAIRIFLTLSLPA